MTIVICHNILAHTLKDITETIYNSLFIHISFYKIQSLIMFCNGYYQDSEQESETKYKCKPSLNRLPSGVKAW